ncbi:hypothetical protein [Streptomyces sp. NPDC007905]|uniref:hypothetical protein n=1 Tax=Streptomyces sp. NPDC007905 TaxID=3364788 RepID=UPI0036E872E4
MTTPSPTAACVLLSPRRRAAGGDAGGEVGARGREFGHALVDDAAPVGEQRGQRLGTVGGRRAARRLVKSVQDS